MSSSLARRSLALPLASALAVLLGGTGMAAAQTAGAAAPPEVMDPATALAPSTQERRAVRGRALPEVVAAPELVWLEKIARGLPVEAADALTGDELPAWTRDLVVPELEIPWSRTLVRLLEHMRDDRRGREATVGLLRRFGRYQSMVEGALAAGGAPRLLAYAALARSGFEPGASARDGAGGFWMLRTEDARQMGVEVDFWLDGRRDPQTSSEAVGRHLGGLHERLGSWQRALAAFSEGEREPEPRPLQVVGETGTAPSTPEADELASTPGGRFVAFTFAVALIGENRAALGFKDPEPLEAPSFEDAEVAGGLTLATLARAAGTGPETIRALNPALLRERTPPDQDQVAVRVPRGAAGILRGALRAALSEGDRLASYKLRFGESLDDVALRLQIAPRELRRLNGVRDSWELRPRTVLVVPQAGSRTAMAEEDLSQAEEPYVVGVPAGSLAVPDRTRVFYKTVEGDTVGELAEVFGVSIDEIIAWNSLDPLAQLQPRMLLLLHVPPEMPREDVALVPAALVKVAALGSEEYHTLECARRGKSRVTVTARQGETLVKIARRYGMSPGDLARVNRFGWSNELPEGQRVVVYSSSPGGVRDVVGRSATPRRPLPAPIPKAAAVGKSRQERAAQASRPPQTPPQSKARGPSAVIRRAATAPKAASPNGPARGTIRR